MHQGSSTPTGPSRNILSLSHAEKVQRFNQAHPAHANTNSTLNSEHQLSIIEKAALYDLRMQPTANTTTTTSSSPMNNGEVHCSNAYSTMRFTSPLSDKDMIADTACDRHMFKDRDKFMDMQDITPISITTADGKASMVASQICTVGRKSFDPGGQQ
ncbi:hypothetical protein CROQUDRAFT_133654 [Cronartium quercuum f. sp. fusiforme G11]|uniref:Uncharacterized protein n=1 Tax=Cronartium quercuum f. sp. fusiforme G11 TaxID=708437 RepID=A0A9P6NH80_9BASI|nr:hypothetical protein CROQUDRAFT_133654 [Cronartium quercuum f. sp. fusiforme G11]